MADHVLPELPVRQWVLSLPHKVRDLLARCPDLAREARGIFARCVQSFYSRRAREQGVASGRCGSIVHVQRFDSALRLDVHWQGLFQDGVFTGFDSRDPLTFHEATPLTDGEVEWLVRHLRALIEGHLHRRGFLFGQSSLADESEEDLDELATHQAAAVKGVVPFGPRSGRQELLFGEPAATPPSRPAKALCADSAGYSLHAEVRIAGHQLGRRERLCRYIARPALAQGRLSVARNGNIVYRFRKRWRNGKEAVVLDPLTFLSRLAAQIPPPRVHVVSYYGVLAPAAARRDEIVPGHREEEPGCQKKARGSDSSKRKRSRPERLSWAELVKRVWLVDVLRCPCGGRRKVLAMVFIPRSIERILRHLGLPHIAPTRAPPRPVPGRLPFSG